MGTGIFNISGSTEDELRVLDKGLKFAPVYDFNKFYTYVNLQKFVRNLNIKKTFLSKPAERAALVPVGMHPNLGNRSVFNPPNVNTNHIDVFRNMFQSDLDSMKVKKIKDPSNIKDDISSLATKKDLVIRSADNGGGVWWQNLLQGGNATFIGGS